MKVSLIGVGLLAISSVVAFGQTAPQSVPRHPSTINQRRAFQQHRIAKGVRSGQLTARETGRLERREASIGRQERHMRAADRGHLTRVDRVRLNRRLNRTSRGIYRDKHNARMR
jgi:hypothetical protein